jgi:NAD-dependent SIR2 family protein deacetylase
MNRRAATGEADAAPRKTVIFLGAGASAADGAPVQSELFMEYFRSGAVQGDVDQQMKDALQRYFDRLWGIHVDGELADTKFPTFEEALGILDIADGRNESFRGMGDDPHATGIQELRGYLADLIAMILDEKLPGSGDGTTHHRLLLNVLGRTDWLKQTTFLSLNYDTFIDDAFKHYGISRGNHTLPDYGVAFTPEPHSNGQPFPRLGLLLKFHGSLNWAHCTACGTLSLFPHHRFFHQVDQAPWHSRCSECHELRVSVIIPPTFFKVMSNFFLQQIWKRAEEELKQAQRIVFCGYSFPDADMHIKYLLKRAEVNRTGPPPTVFIVNEHEGKTDQQREMEKDRYLRFFRRRDQVHWTNLSFQDFAGNPQLIEDQPRWR